MRVGRHLDASGMTHDGVEDVSRIIRGELGQSLQESLDKGGGKSILEEAEGCHGCICGIMPQRAATIVTHTHRIHESCLPVVTAMW